MSDRASSEDPRRQIEAALAKLHPSAGTENHALSRIETWLAARPHLMGEKPRIRKKEAARQLRRATRALRQAAAAIEHAGPAGWIELSRARGEFDGRSSGRSLRELGEATEEAAQNLDLQNQNGGGRPAGRDRYLSSFTAELADLFHLMTGSAAPSGGRESRFSNFVGEIFAAGDIEADAHHWARIGANLLRREAEAIPVVRIDRWRGAKPLS